MFNFEVIPDKINVIKIDISEKNILRDVSIHCVTLITGDRGSRVLRRCVTNRKVAGSIPDGVIGIFH